MISLHDGKANLLHAAKRLQLRWQDVRQQWNDKVSEKFERQHLQPLEPQVKTAIQAIERLAEVLSRAEAECRDSAEYES